MTAARKPPHNVQVLQRWVGELAREQGIAPGRVQRWISFMVVAAMLDHARDENEDPVFVLKGGTAISPGPSSAPELFEWTLAVLRP